MKLKFVRFDYQVLVEGSLVIVLSDFEGAKKFAAENYREAVILPIPVFEYQGTTHLSA